MRLLSYLLAFCLLPSWSGCYSDETTPLTNDAKTEVINSLCEQVRKNYVVSEVGQKVAVDLGRKSETGAYSAVSNHNEFADIVSHDLRDLSGDLHFMVFHTGTPPKLSAKVVAAAELSKIQPKLDMLDGKIAYLHDITKLSTRNRDALVRLMQSAVKADAIIIDLRQCLGGDREIVRLISSYFFSDPIHLVTEDEVGSEPGDVYTLKKVPGGSRAKVDLYILVGSKTASGGEALAYLLKHHERAVIVGSKTMGAAHAVKTYDLPHKYRAFIPHARPIHPRTGTNWEGKGVEPDVAVPEADAVPEALRRLQNSKDFQVNKNANSEN